MLPRSTSASDSVRRFRSGGSDRKSTRLNSSHITISYAVFCLKKKKLVQEYERPPAAVYDEPFLVRALGGEAEETTFLLIRALDVFEAPRSPKPLGHGAGAYAARRKPLLACKREARARRHRDSDLCHGWTGGGDAAPASRATGDRPHA